MTLVFYTFITIKVTEKTLFYIVSKCKLWTDVTSINICDGVIFFNKVYPVYPTTAALNTYEYETFLPMIYF
jgi:hypothetical protein